jgi:hypothetical protein
MLVGDAGLVGDVGCKLAGDDASADGLLTGAALLAVWLEKRKLALDSPLVPELRPLDCTSDDATPLLNVADDTSDDSGATELPADRLLTSGLLGAKLAGLLTPKLLGCKLDSGLGLLLCADAVSDDGAALRLLKGLDDGAALKLLNGTEELGDSTTELGIAELTLLGCPGAKDDGALLSTLASDDGCAELDARKLLLIGRNDDELGKPLDCTSDAALDTATLDAKLGSGELDGATDKLDASDASELIAGKDD